MCLKIEGEAVLKVASEDIKCYKILYEGPRKYHLFGKRKLLSVYTLHEYHYNVLETSRLILETPEQDMTSGDQVNVGLHSFANPSDAAKVRNSRMSFADVYEFIIPAGALYYEGEQFCFPGYASDKLIMKRKLSFNDIFIETRLYALRGIKASLDRISSGVKDGVA